VYAAYDVTGVSDAEPFSIGMLPTRTATPTAPATTTSTASPTSTATATATPTVTVTPRSCGAVADASLEYRPDEFDREGDGPFDVILKLRNTGRQSYAVGVVLVLNTINGASYIDRVDLPLGATWAISGATSAATQAIGDIAPRGEIDVALRIHMLPGWTTSNNATATLRVSIHSAGCTRHASPARATIELAREDDDRHGHAKSITQDTPPSPADAQPPSSATSTASPTLTPVATDVIPSATATPSSAVATVSPTLTATTVASS
jgi:hypothetical protein